MARVAVGASTPPRRDSRAAGCGGEPGTTLEAVGCSGRARQLGRSGDSCGKDGSRRRRDASRSTRAVFIAPERSARRGSPRRACARRSRHAKRAPGARAAVPYAASRDEKNTRARCRSGVLVLWCVALRVSAHRLGGRVMPRLTISLNERTHRALKEAAARQNRSMGAIIEESLELRGIRPLDAVEEIVARARANSGLSADEAMALAVDETRRHREGR